MRLHFSSQMKVAKTTLPRIKLSYLHEKYIYLISNIIDAIFKYFWHSWSFLILEKQQQKQIKKRNCPNVMHSSIAWHVTRHALLLSNCQFSQHSTRRHVGILHPHNQLCELPSQNTRLKTPQNESTNSCWGLWDSAKAFNALKAQTFGGIL